MSSNTVTSLNTYTNIHDDVPNRLHNITVLEYTHDVHEITVSLRKIKIQLNDNLAINILCNNITTQLSATHYGMAGKHAITNVIKSAKACQVECDASLDHTALLRPTYY